MYYTPTERASKTAQDDVFERLKIIKFSWMFLKRKTFSKIGQPLFFKTFVMKTKLFYFENYLDK